MTKKDYIHPQDSEDEFVLREDDKRKKLLGTGGWWSDSEDGNDLGPSRAKKRPKSREEEAEDGSHPAKRPYRPGPKSSKVRNGDNIRSGDEAMTPLKKPACPPEKFQR